MLDIAVNHCLDLTPEIAELLGLLIGDGGVYRYHTGWGRISKVAFTGHESEFPYYRDFVKPETEKAFGVHGRLFCPGDNTARYVVYSKKLVSYLTGIGIPEGRRKDAVIPEVIFESNLVVPFLRGLYHAEGSIYRRYSKQYKGHAKTYDNLLVIQIRTKLPTLMRQLSEVLADLGISANRLTSKDGVFTLRVTSQGEILKFFRLIQPRLKLSPHQQRFNHEIEAAKRAGLWLSQVRAKALTAAGS